LSKRSKPGWVATTGTATADVRSLAARARAASDEGDLAAASSLYAELERQDAGSPEWPRQLASLHRRAGRGEDELDALVRCADRHAERQEFLPALATYKMVLSTDPGHAGAQRRLEELQPGGSISVDYAAQAAEEEAPRADVGARAPLQPQRHSIDPGAPLDELVLTDIVEGARLAHLADVTLDGIHEIPLEMPEDAVHHPATRPRPALAPPDVGIDADAEVHAARLGRSPLFSSLDRRSLARLVERVRLVTLRAGEELFHQGDPAGALYVVAQGAVVPIAEGEPRTRLAVLEAGEFFGEIALFTNQPRNATVEALVDAQLLAIDRKVMWSLVQEHPPVLSLLLRFLRERLIHRLVRTSPLFQIFSAGKRSAIVRRFRFLEVSDGHAVIDQHHPTEAVFILLSGQMDVVHRDAPGAPEGSEKVLASLGPGELFGEMSLLWREPSLASVVARGKCRLLALPAESFQEMLAHHPELAELAAVIAEERRHQNRRTLRDALRHRDGKAGII
jgi:CRP-like cAMP-binding protein